MSHLKRVYIAGPDLFYPDWPEYAARVTQLCQAQGLEAVLPVPPVPLSGPSITEDGDNALALKIFHACHEAILSSDGVIANLSRFRGREPDSGTVTECALAYAAGKPVVGYMNGLGPLLCVHEAEDGRHLCPDGIIAERFDLPHNLMVHGVCTEMVNGCKDAVERAVKKMANLLVKPGSRLRSVLWSPVDGGPERLCVAILVEYPDQENSVMESGGVRALRLLSDTDLDRLFSGRGRGVGRVIDFGLEHLVAMASGNGIAGYPDKQAGFEIGEVRNVPFESDAEALHIAKLMFSAFATTIV